MTTLQQFAHATLISYLQLDYATSFEDVIQAATAKMTYQQVAELISCSESTIGLWKRASIKNPLTKTDNKIIDAMSRTLGLITAADETRKEFARRTLQQAVKVFPKYMIAEIANVSASSVKLLFNKRLLTSPKKGWAGYEKRQESIQRLIAAVKQKQVDHGAVRLLLIATKSGTRTAEILERSLSTISLIFHQEMRQNPDWLQYSCLFCEKVFQPKNLSQRYCSIACRRQAEYTPNNQLLISRDKIRHLLTQYQSATKAAEITGCTLQTICNAFKQETLKNPDWLIFNCNYCGKNFTPAKLYQKFCCKKCQATASRRRRSTGELSTTRR